MIDFALWQKAWELGMMLRGYPNARLDPVVEPEWLSYSWTEDVNRIVNPDRWNEDAPQGAWDAAHAVFLEIDHLRPREVMPSIALAEMLEQRSGE